MQAVCSASSGGLLPPDGHDPGSPVTVSFTVFPALNVGDVDADIETASPVLRLRPVRAGRLLVPKVPNPGSRTSSPSASNSQMIANTPSTASLAAPLPSPVRAAKRSAISVLFSAYLPLRRSAQPPFPDGTVPGSRHRLPRMPAPATPGCAWARPFRRRRFRRPAGTACYSAGSV